MSDVITASVAAEVRAEMGRQRVSQRRIAEVIGLSQQAVSRRLSGEVPFDVAELGRIAAELGVLADVFLRNSTPPGTPRPSTPPPQPKPPAGPQRAYAAT